MIRRYLTDPLYIYIYIFIIFKSESYRNSSHQFNNNNDNYFDQNLSGGEFSTSSNGSNNRFDERAINELEQKVHSLENKIEELKADNCDYNDRCSKLQMEN